MQSVTSFPGHEPWGLGRGWGRGVGSGGRKEERASEWRYHSVRSLGGGKCFRSEEGRRGKHLTFLFLTWGTTGQQEHGRMGDSHLSVH